jgi:hypothetical protein
VCCGRALISKGFTKQAAAQARKNVLRLSKQVEDAYIVGCEPCCLLTPRHEYPELVDRPKTSLVASRSLLIDEFLERLAANDDLELSFGGAVPAAARWLPGGDDQRRLLRVGGLLRLRERALRVVARGRRKG